MGPSQIARPLLKVMSYVIPVNMHTFPLSINPPRFAIHHFVQTCDKRLDLPKVVDVLLPVYTGGYLYIYSMCILSIYMYTYNIIYTYIYIYYVYT